MKHNFVCDLETTGTQAGCCILSVALVRVGGDWPDDQPAFYQTISHIASLDAGFFDEEDTLLWWNRQHKDVQDEAFSGVRNPIQVMESLAHYLKGFSTDPKEIFIWGYGKDFDNVILTAYFKKLGLELPWSFRNNRCLRDLAAYYPAVESVKSTVPHHALHDAIAEATYAAKLFNVARRLPPALPFSL